MARVVVPAERHSSRGAGAPPVPRTSARACLPASLLAAAFLLAAWPVKAQGDEAPAGRRATSSGAPFVRASVRPDSATVGDRLRFALELDRPSEVGVGFPEVRSAVAPFEVLGEAILEPEERDGRVIERREYVLAAFETGELSVPALPFEYVGADGDSFTTWTDSITIVIGSVLPEVKESEEVGPKDIKAPVELPRRVWPYAVAALCLAGAAVAYRYLRDWLRKLRRPPAERVEAEPPVPRIAAHVVAFERLEALNRDDPIGRGDIHAFYVRITEILRLYLRDRFGVDAIDMTTAEIAPAMFAAGIGTGEIDWTTSYLTHADLAKFAKHVPTAGRANEDFESAWRFVEKTRFVDSEGGGDGTVEEAR